jgi:hypothetical protein
MFKILRYVGPYQFCSCVPTADEKPLILTVFEKRPFRSSLASNREDAQVIFIFERWVNIRHEKLTNPVLYEIAKMKTHFILILESIRVGQLLSVIAPLEPSA